MAETMSESALRLRLHPDVEALLRRMGEAAAAAGARAWEARSEETIRQSYHFEGTRHARTDVAERAGLGIQVYLAGGGAGYAFTTRFSAAAAEHAVERALRLARGAGDSPLFPADRKTGGKLEIHPGVKRHPAEAPLAEKLDLARRAALAAEEAGRGQLKRVEVAWGEQHGRRTYLASDGRLVVTHPLHATLEAVAMTRDGARTGTGRASVAGATGLEAYAGARSPEEIGAKAARQAVLNLGAEAMPAGRFPAVIDPHLAGVLAHESFGHLSEYDTIYAKWSILHNRKGDRLGPEHVTISDAGIVDPADSAHGVWVPVDDEGAPANKVTILENGVLKRFMHSRLTASHENLDSTGNGRCVSVSYPTMVRMRNTFFEPGEWTREELLAELKDGYYACGSTGGQPTADGSFVFKAWEGWRVENGELAAPVKGVTLLGNILDYMPNILAASRDFRVHTMFFGGCGKWGQNDLAVGVGGPHLLLKQAHFGGSSA